MNLLYSVLSPTSSFDIPHSVLKKLQGKIVQSSLYLRTLGYTTYPDNERYYKELFETLTQWYTVVKHEIEHHPGFPRSESANYWDSLFILTELLDD